MGFGKYIGKKKKNLLNYSDKPYFVDGKQAQENNPTACNTR
jgi:hypothetical protein